MTDGPFAEGAEVAGGYYVFEADDLDEALRLARHIPAARYGAVEVWPTVHWNPPSEPTTSADWLALLLEPADQVTQPCTPEWDAGACRHAEFNAAAGDHVLEAGLRYQPAACSLRMKGLHPVVPGRRPPHSKQFSPRRDA